MLRRLHHEQPDSFAFTSDNQKWAEAQITKYPEGRQASAIIPILWRAQEQEGWLTRPAIEYVAEMLDMAYIRVLEVATFYFMFQLQPVGSVAHIQVCGTTSCMICGAEDLIGVCSANEFLTRVNLMKAYLFPKVDTPIPRGKDVVVLGAGNVAMDSARTSMRLGADKVRIVYRRSRQEMPARGAEIHHAEEEGIEFFLLTAPTKFLGNESGRVTSMECLKMELGEPDASGRRRPVPIEGSEFELECDLVIVAVGTGANPILTQSTNGLKLNKWGYIEVDEKTAKTTKKGVWAGGDIVTGSATVILAMGAGRTASDSIHDYLTLGW